MHLVGHGHRRRGGLRGLSRSLRSGRTGQSGAKSAIQDTPKPTTTQNGQKQDGPTSAGKKTGNAAKPPTT